MTKIKVALAGLVAGLAVGLCSADVVAWFDAKIGALENWPSDAHDLTIDGDFNGMLTVWGATTLEAGGDWTKATSDARFYRAVLTQ